MLQREFGWLFPQKYHAEVFVFFAGFCVRVGNYVKNVKSCSGRQHYHPCPNEGVIHSQPPGAALKPGRAVGDLAVGNSHLLSAPTKPERTKGGKWENGNNRI